MEATHILQNINTGEVCPSYCVGGVFFKITETHFADVYPTDHWKIIHEIGSAAKGIKPHRTEYHSMYQQMASIASQSSHAKRKKVGALVVTLTGMLSIGWNGMPSGFDNCCEDENGVTRPEVIHAEQNAIDKMTREGVSADGSILFTTFSPCMECAKRIQAVGIRAVYFKEIHCEEALKFLTMMGVYHEQWED